MSDCPLPPARRASRTVDAVANPEAITDAKATWPDYPYASGPGQSDGTLVLSDNRLTFATTGAELVLDVDLDGFDSATTGNTRNGRTLLTVRYLDDTQTSFWTRENFAQQVVEAIQARPR